MNIFYRTCEKFNPTNGSRPNWCHDVKFKLKCFKSLVDSLSIDECKINIIGDNLTASYINELKNICPKVNFINSERPLGNQNSLMATFKAAENLSSPNEIVFFCEDDYIFAPKFYQNIKSFFAIYGKTFKDVFYHPTDYPDQYKQDRIRKSFIFLNQNGGWFREVGSTTFTFACSSETFRKYCDLLKDCSMRKVIFFDKEVNQKIYSNIGADDGRFSEIFSVQPQEAFCFSPMPGDSAHLHEGTQSLFIDWKSLYQSIKL